MLVAADTFRSIWLFVFPILTFVKGPVPTRNGFCQASGYMTQMSFEMTDFAALLIAIHTALQVFRPKPRILGQGGLHAYRYYIYVAILVFPSCLAAIAFIDGRYAYLSQGPMCSLPIRPFWYRLATSWIPRYLIILVVLLLYVAIYIHAEHNFSDSRLFRGRLIKAMRRLSDSRRKSRAHGALVSPDQPGSTVNCESDCQRGTAGGSSSRRRSDSGQQQSPSSFPTTEHQSTRQAPSVTGGTNPPLASSPDNKNTHSCHSLNWQLGQTSPAQGSPQAVRSREHSHPDEQEPSLTSSGIDTRLEVEEMRKKHSAIRKQLRLLFVYPVIYFLAWVGPFVLHGTLYNSSLAAHPIFGLALWTYICYAILGFLDALVFSLRERPWRHIPGNDGTIIGSFQFWQHTHSSVPRGRAFSEESGDTTRRRDSSTVGTLGRHQLSMPEAHEMHRPLEQIMTPLSTAPRPSKDHGLRHEDTELRRMASWDFGRARANLEKNI